MVNTKLRWGLLLIFLLSCVRVMAQDEVNHHPFYAFLQPNPENTSERQLIMVDALTGEQVMISANGERYTIFGRSILFFDRTSKRVKVVTPDGEVRDHPFMQLDSGAIRVDWVASNDSKVLAWTVTRSDQVRSLTTVTRVAAADGSDERELLTDTRADGLRIMPVAFDHSQTKLYLDYQPDGLGNLTAYPQYAGLFVLPLDGGVPEFLPGEPGDFTGAGFGGEFFLRLALTSDLTRFDLRVYNLATGFDRVIPALNLRGSYSQAGDILISPDGTRAIYALSQISGFGSAQQTIRTVFVLVDLINMTQTNLTEVTTFVRPVAWTEDNSAVIFTSPQQTGTWKISLENTRLEKIAEPTYLGMLQSVLE